MPKKHRATAARRAPLDPHLAALTRRYLETIGPRQRAVDAVKGPRLHDYPTTTDYENAVAPLIDAAKGENRAYFSALDAVLTSLVERLDATPAGDPELARLALSVRESHDIFDICTARHASRMDVLRAAKATIAEGQAEIERASTVSEPILAAYEGHVAALNTAIEARGKVGYAIGGRLFLRLDVLDELAEVPEVGIPLDQIGGLS